MWAAWELLFLCLVGGAGATLLGPMSAFVYAPRLPRSPDVVRITPQEQQHACQSIARKGVVGSPLSVRPTTRASPAVSHSLRMGGGSGFGRGPFKTEGRMGMSAVSNSNSNSNGNGNGNSNNSNDSTSTSTTTTADDNSSNGDESGQNTVKIPTDVQVGGANKSGDLGVAFVGLANVSKSIKPLPRVGLQQQGQYKKRRKKKPSRPVSIGSPLLSKATTPGRVPLGNDVEAEPPAVAAAAATKVSPGADRRGPWKWIRPPWHNRKQAVPDTCGPAIAPDAASATMVAAPLGGERSTSGKHQRNRGSWGSSTSSLPMLPPAREPSDVSASRPPPSPLGPLPVASTSKESQQQQQQQEAEEGNRVVDAVLYAINLGWPWSQVAALGEKVVSPQLRQQQAEMSEEASRIVDSMLGMIKLGVKLGWPWTPESTSPAAAAPDQEGVMTGATPPLDGESKELPLSFPKVPPDPPQEEEGVGGSEPPTRGGRSFSRVKEAIVGTVLGSRLLRTTTTTGGAPGAITKRSSTADDAPLPSVAGAPAAPPRSAAPTLSLPPAAASLRRIDGSSAGPAPASRAPWRPPGYRWGKSLVSNMSGSPDVESERVTATTDDGGGGSSRQVAGVGAASAGAGWSPSAAAAADEQGGGTEATRGVQGQQEEAQQRQLSSRRMSVFRALSTTAGGVATRFPLMRKSRSDDAREQDLADQADNRNSVGEWASVEVSPPASTKADATEGGANGAQGSGGGGGGGGGVPWWQAGAAVLVGVGAALYRPVNRLPGLLFKDEKEEEQRRRQGEEGRQQGTLSQVDATTSPASFQLARPAEEVASVPPEPRPNPPPQEPPPQEPPPQETTSSGSRARQGVAGLVDRAATMSRRARLWTLLKRRSRARAEPLLTSVDTSIMSLTPSELLSPPVEEQETALSSSSDRGPE
ncbi:unnamed protein product, partial [Ectocarpus sp. 8 AP-2014]